MEHLIINIGRQFGSGGRLVAMELGRRLGMNAYDNELISKAAEESGFSKELFLKSDEKRSIFSMSSFFTSGAFSLQKSFINQAKSFGGIRERAVGQRKNQVNENGGMKTS